MSILRPFRENIFCHLTRRKIRKVKVRLGYDISQNSRCKRDKNLPSISSRGSAEIAPVKSDPTLDATSLKIAFSTGINTCSTSYPGSVSIVYKNDETTPSPKKEPLQGTSSPFTKQRVLNEGLATGTGTGAGGGATGFFVGFFVGSGIGFDVGLRVGLFVGLGSGLGAGGTQTHSPLDDFDLPDFDLPDLVFPDLESSEVYHPSLLLLSQDPPPDFPDLPDPHELDALHEPDLPDLPDELHELFDELQDEPDLPDFPDELHEEVELLHDEPDLPDFPEELHEEPEDHPPPLPDLLDELDQLPPPLLDLLFPDLLLLLLLSHHPPPLLPDFPDLPELLDQEVSCDDDELDHEPDELLPDFPDLPEPEYHPSELLQLSCDDDEPDPLPDLPDLPELPPQALLDDQSSFWYRSRAISCCRDEFMSVAVATATIIAAVAIAEFSLVILFMIKCVLSALLSFDLNLRKEWVPQNLSTTYSCSLKIKVFKWEQLSAYQISALYLIETLRVY